MQNIAIILGGGDGTRAGGVVPKQFQTLDGMPVLLHSINAMRAGGADKIYVVLHPEFLREWEEILSHLPYEATVVCGGKSRWHSVKNALEMIADDGVAANDLIAVHDGARPLVPLHVVTDGWETARRRSTAVPVVKVTDSLRQMTGDDTSIALDRSLFRAVQTPQTFNAGLLIKAYDKPYDTQFTDDASVVESLGAEIHLYHGAYDNIKITHPGDLAVVEVLMRNRVR